MIQFNLLPDIKQQYIKARQSQRMVITVATVVGAASLFILVLMFTVVNVLQKTHIKDVNKDIAKYNNQLQSDTDLPKVLSVQSQLKSLPNLHATKPVTSRLFGYLTKVVPAKVNISQLNLDFSQGIITISGDTDSISTVNQFVDTLKFTNYTLPDSTASKNAFSNVVLSTFSHTDKGAAYTINLTFDPVIFNSAYSPNLVVPNITTTRSEIDKPGDLFKTSSTSQQGAQ